MPVPPSQPGEHTQHTLFIKIFVVVYAAGDKDDARITKAFFFLFFWEGDEARSKFNIYVRAEHSIKEKVNK